MIWRTCPDCDGWGCVGCAFLGLAPDSLWWCCQRLADLEYELAQETDRPV